MSREDGDHNRQLERSPDPFAQSGEPAPLPEGSGAAPAGRKLRILLVEDFATMRRIMRNLLADIGYHNIVEADGGAAALSILHNEAVDLVLSDLKMPDISGLELLKAIRADRRLSHIPVLIVTADAQRENIERAARAGVSGYIIKPFSASILADKIRQATGAAAGE